MNRASQVDAFIARYEPALMQAVQDHGSEYAFKLDRCAVVAERMRSAFYEGSYQHDGRAIKATCKALGIKHTRTAMEAFFNKRDDDAFSNAFATTQPAVHALPETTT